MSDSQFTCVQIEFSFTSLLCFPFHFIATSDLVMTVDQSRLGYQRFRLVGPISIVPVHMDRNASVGLDATSPLDHV